MPETPTHDPAAPAGEAGPNHECLLLGNGVIHVLNAGRDTTPPCPSALFKVGDVVKVRRLKHLKNLPEKAGVAIVVPPNFPAEYALADAKGSARPLMTTVPYKCVSYIVGFENDRTPHLIKEKDLVATGERAEVRFEEPSDAAL